MTEPFSKLIVRVAGGKYTFRVHELAISIERGGERWHRQTEGLNAITSIMCELDAARVVLEAARKAINTPKGDTRAMVKLIDAIADAVAKHDRLVDDKEPPSAWCLP